MNPDPDPVDPMTDLLAVDSWEALSVLPDGTIISWLRIPGDPTSRAIAFLRRDVDPETGDDLHWITPGGWEPMSPAQAAMTYPVSIVRIPGIDNAPADATEWVETEGYAAQIAADTRRACLQMAVRWTAPLNAARNSAFTGTLFDVAEAFAGYIREGRVDVRVSQ